MDDITHISVRPRDDGDPATAPTAVYVAAPAPDALDEEPFLSGRHRIERTPGADEKPPTTLWSWSQPGG